MLKIDKATLANQETKRVEALKEWFVTIDQSESQKSESVKPLTREEVYATRLSR